MDKVKVDKLEIDGSVYIRQDSVQQSAEKLDDMDYVLIRSHGAGVFIGYLKSKEYQPAGTVVTLVNSRNIYYWNGAAGISQIAENGISDSSSSKLTIPVKLREVSNVIEILPISKTAQENLDKIPVWKR